jgi:PAS domain S-box-containing protein
MPPSERSSPSRRGLRAFVLELSPDLGEVRRVRPFLDEVAEIAGLSHERAFDLKVAVSEACANAIEHAGPQEQPVRVSAVLEDVRLTVQVEGRGGFQLPGQGPSERRQHRGLGFPLMVALSDALSVERFRDGTRVIFTFLVDGSPLTLASAPRHVRSAGGATPGSPGAAEESLLDVFERITDAFFGLDSDWRFTWVNPKAEALLQRRAEDILGKVIWEEFPEAVGTTFQDRYLQTMTTQQPATFEDYYEPLDLWVEVRAYPSPSGISVYFRDVAARKRAEAERERLLEELITERSRLQATLSSLTEGLVVADPSGGIVEMNAEALRIHRITEKEDFPLRPGGEALVEVRTPTGEVLLPEEWPLARIARGESLRQVDLEIGALEQGDSWVGSYSGAPVRDARGEIVLLLLTMREVTRERRIVEALRRSEERFRATFEHAAVGVALVGIDGRWRRVNDRLVELFGYSRAELQRLTFQDVTHPDDLSMDLALAEELLSGKRRRYTLEKRYVRKDGQILWGRLTGALVRDNDGRPEYFVAVIEDVTVRRKVEEERAALMRQLEAVATVTDVAMSSLRLEELLPSVLAQLVDVLQADTAVIMLKQGDQLVTRATYGLGDEADTNFAIPVGEGFSGSIAAAGAPLYLADARSDPQVLNPFLKRRGIRTMLGVPLKRAEELVGVLHVDWLTHHDEDPNEIRLLELVADRVSLAILNAQLFARTQEAELLGEALNDINEVVHSSLDPGEIMERVVREAAGAVGADAAILALRQGEMWEVDQAHGLPEGLVGARLTEAEVNSLRILRSTRAPLVLAHAEDDPRLNQQALRQWGIRSLLMIPLLAREEVIGALAFAYIRSVHEFTAPQLDFAAKLGASLSLSVENALLYQAERRINETLQEALRTVPGSVAGVRYGHLYRSASEEAHVGGDFYDLFALEEGRVGLLVGDVAGHGIQAATTASLVRETVRAYALDEADPAQVVAKTNRALLLRFSASRFTTLLFASLETRTGRLWFSSAGHPPALLRRGSGLVERLRAPGPPVGVFDDASYEGRDVQLSPGDTLLLYTDGVIEARREKEIFGEKRLAVLVAKAPRATAELLPEVVLEEVREFASGDFSDDIALLAVGLRSSPPDA